MISLAPIIMPWTADKVREFYKRVADTPAIDTVYVGEIVCDQRRVFHHRHLDACVELLRAAGKTVVLSSPILIQSADDESYIRDISQRTDMMIEANDMSMAHLLQGRAFVAGPYLNIYNCTTASFLANLGCVRVCVPFESHQHNVQEIVRAQIPVEVMVWGHLPLAISGRCFSAHNAGFCRDDCHHACYKRGVASAQSMDHAPLFQLNGPQVLAAKTYDLRQQMGELQTLGVQSFRFAADEQVFAAIESMDDAVFAAGTTSACNGFMLDVVVESWSA